LKSLFAWPKYDEPKGSNVLIILHYKDYPTLAKHNSFITGSNVLIILLYKDYPTLAKHNSFITESNVFHLNNIKSSNKMN
jgi:hypothetical protein